MALIVPPTGEDDKGKEEKKPRPLEPSELKKAIEEEGLSADVTYESVRREGEKELRRSSGSLGWSALAGGLAMGFSFLTESLLHAHLPDASWRPLITKLGYPVGFVIISMGSQQLFTENTLTPIVPLLLDKSRAKFLSVMRLWGVTLAANIAGTLLFALVLARTTTFDAQVQRAFTDVAREALRGTFLETFLRAVFAGWLIALMVWMLPASKTAQHTTIIIMTYVVGIGGLAHIIVGSTEVLYLVIAGQATMADYFIGFFLPALTGNVVGGLALVAGLNHAQVVE
ncbi:MAG: formate/nitrite transporter family protein [Gemmatimonadaceae bacterium]